MMNHETDEIGYRIIDGKRVPLAEYVTEARYGRESTRLDASYGYKKRVEMHDGTREMCTVFVTRGLGVNKERYATVARPNSDRLVAFRCFRLTGPRRADAALAAQRRRT